MVSAFLFGTMVDTLFPVAELFALGTIFAMLSEVKIREKLWEGGTGRDNHKLFSAISPTDVSILIRTSNYLRNKGLWWEKTRK